MSSPSVEILPDKTALIQRALEIVLERVQDAIATQGRCTLALSGGSTPLPLYKALAEQDLPWDKLYVFWGDERYVPLDHPDSNAGAAKAVWLDQVPIPPEQIFYTPTSGSPETDAATYQDTVQAAFGDLEAIPQFDIILLGMGDDGHTASLFPHTAALHIEDRLITVGDKEGTPRITFTFPLINEAKTVLFVVAGADKQPALAQVFSPDGDDDTYPSRRVQGHELIWLLDATAGAALPAT